MSNYHDEDAIARIESIRGTCTAILQANELGIKATKDLINEIIIQAMEAHTDLSIARQLDEEGDDD